MTASTNTRKRSTRASAKEENKKQSSRARRGNKTSVPESVLRAYPSEKWEVQWINNEGGEIERILGEYPGSEVCKGVGIGGVWSPDNTATSTSDVVSRPAGKGKHLDSIDMVLMAIPRSMWEEEKELRHAEKQEVVQALRHGKDQSGAASGTSGGTYAPNLPDGQRGFSESISGELHEG